MSALSGIILHERDSSAHTHRSRRVMFSRIRLVLATRAITRKSLRFCAVKAPERFTKRTEKVAF